ncbi:MAG: magnesium transporter [Gammaproteobacteria bacterium]|nr:magnesium transporter [Gammaproteobacteria bacterium]MCB1849800.1 magnesium transporter [Gammaproteobacteria bacterium]MCP5418386.1 magnesium transporter [Chromatiaceae bacterium]
MTDSTRFEPWVSLRYYAEAGEQKELEAFVEAIGPSEAFRALLRLSQEERELVLTTISPTEAADFMEEIPAEHAADLIEQLSVSQAASIVNEMESAEKADLLADMEVREAEAILAELPPQEAAQVRELIRYSPDVAGGMMVTEYLAFQESATVSDALQGLSAWVENRPEQEAHIYIISPAGILIGAIDLQRLVLSQRNAPLSRILKPARFVSVNYSLDELDSMFECHQLPAVAVVDDHQKLLGILRRDDLVQALQKRADADHLKSQGIVGGDEIRSLPVLTRTKRRLSWLSLNIVLNIIAASVIALYEDTLSAVIALAVFLPIVSDMSGCSGNQAVAVSMRELSLGIVKPYEAARVWLQEVKVGMINGVVLGCLIAIAAYIWKGNPYLGVVVGVALMLNTLVAVSIGGTVPLLLKRMKVDPAVASGPILTTITDMCGFFLVLSVATLFLPKLVGV